MVVTPALECVVENVRRHLARCLMRNGTPQSIPSRFIDVSLVRNIIHRVGGSGWSQAVVPELIERGYLREPVGSYMTIDDERQVIQCASELSEFWLEITGGVLPADGIGTIGVDILIVHVSTLCGEEARQLRESLAAKMRQLNEEHQYQKDADDQNITLYDDELDQLDADIREIHDFARFELFPAIRDLRDRVGTECSLLLKRLPVLAACDLSLEELGPLEQLIDELREVERLGVKATAPPESIEEGTSSASPVLDDSAPTDEELVWISKCDLKVRMDVSDLLP